MNVPIKTYTSRLYRTLIFGSWLNITGGLLRRQNCNKIIPDSSLTLRKFCEAKNFIFYIKNQIDTAKKHLSNLTNVIVTPELLHILSFLTVFPAENTIRIRKTAFL